ncbi:MAG: hypothetical protein K1060chlam1_01038 [Candidatus Anoxychlamydiales bacterium]|nr:hypothetical protein [Candidatus Anoxychlamydiales bacterium]
MLPHSGSPRTGALSYISTKKYFKSVLIVIKIIIII